MSTVDSPADLSLLSPFQTCGLFLKPSPELLEELNRDLERIILEDGETLFHQDDVSDAMYILLCGHLAVTVSVDGGPPLRIGEIGPGEPVGELQLLSGGKRTATATATVHTELTRLPRETFERIRKKVPQVLTPMVDLVHRRIQRYRLKAVLPTYFGTVNDELLAEIEQHIRWVHLNRGELLFRQGDRDTSLYILMSGRLRATVELEDGTSRVVGDVTPGESVGEMALFTGEDRSASIRSIRDSELIMLSKDSVENIAMRYPQAIMEITRIVVRRLRRNIKSEEAVGRTGNLVFIALHPDFPLGAFIDRFTTALSAYSTVKRLNSAKVDEILGRTGIAELPEQDPDNIRLQVWLQEQEVKNDFVIYEADPTATNWSMRCIRQADRIILVSEADRDPEPSIMEKDLLGFGSAAGIERILLLIHDDETALPHGTERWLDRRDIDDWFHLRRSSDTHLHRVARHLKGQAFGTVLGGGGAKGFAHIGVMQAIVEAGIPVDMIAGTSMGSIIAGEFATGRSFDGIVDTVKDMFARYKPFKEYTLPLFSLIGSKRIDQMLQAHFGDTRIEDLWIPFFCVATNLTRAEIAIHRRGLLWKAIRSSIAIPGIVLPVIEGEDLLVDGGMVNNLPADIMKSLFGGKVLAVDVCPPVAVEVDRLFAQFPSPWKALLTRKSSHGKPTVSLPRIGAILLRTSMLSNVHNLELVKREADWYFNVPVEQYGLLDFEAIESISEIGLKYTQEKLAESGAPVQTSKVVS